MIRSRRFARSSFVLLLIAACIAVAIAPMLSSAIAAPASSSAVEPDVVISQFRFIGQAVPPKGAEVNEFVELYNRNPSSAVSLDGWTLKFSTGASQVDLLYSFSGVTLASGQYFLLANADSELAATADATYPASLNIDSQIGGVALFKVGSTDPVDQVGFDAGYHEGDALQYQAYTGNQGYVRKTATSKYVDTNDNLEDFTGPIPSNPKNPSVGPGIPKQTITGTVTGADGVLLKYTDISGVVQTVTPDLTTHLYTITVPSNWSGTVTASLAGYSITPSSRTYTNLVTNPGNQDYTAVVSTPTKTPVPGYLSVVVNEVGWAGTQYSAADQWIELYNTTNHPIDFQLDSNSYWQLIGPSGTIGKNGVLNLTGVIPAKGFYVIEKHADQFQNLPAGAVTQVDANLNLSTYGQRLDLEGPTGSVDQANHLGGKWPAGSNKATNSRLSMERHNASADIYYNWYTFAGSGQVRDKGGNTVKGTPGYKNWAYSVTATVAPTSTKYKTPTPRPPTPFAHMAINEFLPRSATDWNQDKNVDVFDEFIEVKNLGPIDVDLKGWKLDVISSGGNSSYILPSTKLTTGQRAVFYRKTTNLALPDSGGTVRLTNTRSVIIDARSYGPAQNPDQSICRIPDGYYWRFPCFPTPGNENSLTGVAPAPPPVVASQVPCLMADIVPAPFRDAECYGFGADVFSPYYWDDQAGFKEFQVPDLRNKWRAIVR